MLDTDTKRRIDSARDILVGKVPDPKSQVEQITIALIYKFMDDMDAESEEMGGSRKFFANDYARYGWAKLMRSGLGGHETLNLYAEAIAKMPENPGIPSLFREIFKNAYLPYRDPETLRAFLKIIDEFEYDHSERLGDAFEYLLSVLGSQGDAGQFRTPRHIIDFVVAVVNPKKTETVLDPACGTAGFLISSYKHILKVNTDSSGNSTLTPEERGRVAEHIRGYDISPDMVRLSLVNLYLHGFIDPHIIEYDTLTSQDRWGEYADVILANPPFMSPKGGIRPHNRFSVQSKRSEVLFVDYMAEHLMPGGRAGIIVPEGVIFQSGTAYKQLRKLLVEDSLVAVISLPPGVFNPYSGVKTSILILDKSLAKHSPSIGFFKVENDGFGLGAQRRETIKDDLPKARSEIADYFGRLLSRESADGFAPTLGLVVSKAKIAANGDYNLSLERYREGVINLTTFRLVSLAEVFTKIGNGVNVTQLDEGGKYRVSRIQTISDGSVNLEKTKFTNDEVKPEFFLHRGDILLSHINSLDHLGKTAIFLESSANVIHGINLVRLVPDKSQIDPDFAIRIFKTARFIDTVKSFAQKAVNQASVRTSDLRAIQIPLPPLEIQKEIVAEIEGYQRVIDGARIVLENYRPHITVQSDWPMVAIKEVAAVESGHGFPLDYQGKKNEEIPFLKVSDMNLLGNEEEIVSWNHSVSRAVLHELKGGAYPKGTVIFPKIGAAIATNKKRILTRDSTYDNNVMGIVPNTKCLIPSFLHAYLLEFDLSRWASESEPPSMRKTTVEAHEIPVPPLAVQQIIVAEIDAERALVAANHELIARFEKKIHAILARVWGEGIDVGG